MSKVIQYAMARYFDSNFDDDCCNSCLLLVVDSISHIFKLLIGGMI